VVPDGSGGDDVTSQPQVEMQRIWPHKDAGAVKVYRLPRKTLFEQTLLAWRETVRGRTLTHFLLKLELCTFVLYERQLVLFAKHLDAQSSMQTILDISAFRVQTKIKSLRHAFYSRTAFAPADSSRKMAQFSVARLAILASPVTP